MKALFRFLLTAAVLAAWSAMAQPYGLTSRPAVGPFLNSNVPPVAPGVSGNWSTVKAFPNLPFTNALGLAAVPGTSNLVVWEREGRIWMFTNDPNTSVKKLVLDLSYQCQGWDDSGLLDLAFHPGYATNRQMFVYYTWVVPGTVVGSPTQRPTEYVPGKYHDRLSRFTLNASGVTSTNGETVLVDQVADSVWHNGGGMFFHPVNGFLYWTDGDDERAPTQIINQNLLSGVFRIDVDRRGGSISHPPPRQPANGTTANYFIPNDNPFVGQAGVLEEFWALGLRSPHRMTYDPPSGRIFIGDVGASSREEIDLIEPTESFGLNFQWSRIEGLGGDLAPPYIGINKRPILDYGHDEGQAVIGGYVYRGQQFATDLGGRYVFGDNVQKKIWVMEEGTVPATKTLLCYMPTGAGPNSGSDYTGLSSFGLDANNELYLCQMSSQGGYIYKLSRSGPPPSTNSFPALLSQTGAFDNTATLAPASGLLPYDVNTPLWSDGATKTRWMAIPTNTAITYSPTGEWTFPAGSVFVKHFELPVDEAHPNVHRRLETRLLVRDTNGAVFGATYKWRADNSDADLLPAGLDEPIVVTNATGMRTQTWHYPSRSECLGCHTPAAKGVLGVKTRQSNRNFTFPSSGVTDNQLRTWNHIGLLSPALNESGIPGLTKLVSINDGTADLETRVRSYLDANCAQCHRPGGAPALWDARFDTPLAAQGIVNGTVANNLGIAGARVVVPTDTNRSILFQRADRVGQNQMPPLAKNVVDTNAMAVIAEWITSLPPSPTGLPAPWRHQDIGSVGYPGDANYAGGAVTVSASGDDIWNNADAFHFAYVTLSGDGEIIAHVTDVLNTDGWAKAGVMMRESLAAGARHAFTCVTPGNGVAFQRRVTTDGTSDHTAGPAVTAPYWVRLTRTNTTVTAWSSADGASWAAIGSISVNFPNTIYWGLAVTAHNNTAVTTASFDNVRGSVAPFNWPPTITITSPSNNSSFISPGSLLITVKTSDSEGPVAKVELFDAGTKLGESTNAPFSILWQGIGLGAHTLTARATDNLGATNLSSSVHVNILAQTVTMVNQTSDGQFQLTFTGEPGHRYVIDASTDLKTWQPISTNQMSGDTFQYTDPNTSLRWRFYRVHPAP